MIVPFIPFVTVFVKYDIWVNGAVIVWWASSGKRKTRVLLSFEKGKPDRKAGTQSHWSKERYAP